MARIIDVIIIGTLVTFISVVCERADQKEWAPVAALLGIWCYAALLESSSTQATLGKRLLGLKLTTLGGERVTLSRATGRFFAEVLNFLFLGLGNLLAIFTERRQTLRDLVAGTIVVRRSATPEEIRSAPPSHTSGLLVAVAVIVGGIAVITGPIAIPAYQNYTIRAQVTDALTRSDAYKTEVAESMAKGAAITLLNTTANGIITPRDAGRYATSIDVTNGVIIITYGGQANQRLQGKHLAIYPIQDSGGDIYWVCGLAKPSLAIDAQSIEWQRGLTSVDTQFLPTSCHS